MNIYLDRVKENKKDALYRLLQFSLFEESQTDGNEMNEEAIFEYKYFDSYFTDNKRDAFFIREKDTDKLLGFVMINTHMEIKEKGHSIAEFMVIPKYRRNKIGKKAVFMCFDMYDGIWEVSPCKDSITAYNFWKNVIDEYTNKNNEYINKIFVFEK